MSDYIELREMYDAAMSRARVQGFRMGLLFAAMPTLGGLVFLCAAQVWLAERADAKARRAEVEAAACATELANRRTAEAAFRTCVNGTFAMQTELQNLVRTCR